VTPPEPNRDLSLRVSDADRDATAELLRDAHADGRLSYEEFTQRLDAAYSARTKGDLVPLTQDLPGREAGPAVARRPAQPPSSVDRRLPAALRGAWYAWAVAVSVNVVIWAIVSVTSGQFSYPWPLWVAGPWGAVLLVATFFGGQAADHRNSVER